MTKFVATTKPQERRKNEYLKRTLAVFACAKEILALSHHLGDAVFRRTHRARARQRNHSVHLHYILVRKMNSFCGYSHLSNFDIMTNTPKG